jgi:type II secretory pathway pseudopilin PulG
MPSFNAKHRGQRTAGFSLIALLIVIAILGMTSAASLQIGALLQRRGAEDELLRIGGEFREALISYGNATPIGQPRSPRSLQDLLKDPRYPNPRRHLRKHYADPISGTDEWGAIESPGASGITGIYSRAEGQPIKEAGFEAGMEFFAGSAAYREWIFTDQAPTSKVGTVANPFHPPASQPVVVPGVFWP